MMFICLYNVYNAFCNHSASMQPGEATQPGLVVVIMLIVFIMFYIISIVFIVCNAQGAHFEYKA